MRRTNLRRGLPVIGALLSGSVLAGCGASSAPETESSIDSTPSGSTAPSPSESASGAGSPSASPRPLARTEQARPFLTTGSKNEAGAPLGQVTVRSIRVGANKGFDRVVLDLDGGLPTWHANYQRRFRAEGSGEPVGVPGRRGLAVSLVASGHDLDYKPVYKGPTRITGADLPTGLSTLRGVVLTGDFEGYLSLAFGLRTRAPYRIFTLRQPDRLVIDFKR